MMEWEQIGFLLQMRIFPNFKTVEQMVFTIRSNGEPFHSLFPTWKIQ